MTQQLSAVAAAKARQAQYREQTYESDSNDEALPESENEDGQFIPKDRRLSQSDLNQTMADITAMEESDEEGADAEVPIGPRLAGPDLELSILDPAHATFQSKVTTNLARKEVHVYPSDRIAYLGVYDFRVMAGVVAICGAALASNPTRWFRVHAFASHSLPVMSLMAGGSRGYAIVEFACPIDAFPDDACPRKQVTMRILQKVSSNFVNLWIPSSMAKVGKNQPPITFGYLHKSIDDPLNRRPTAFDISKPWATIAENLTRSLGNARYPVVLICGGQLGQNSLFAQILTNNILSRQEDEDRVVMFLDLDPIHPDYGPPGQVSLVMVRSMNFGPPFIHAHPGVGDQNTVIYSHAIPKYAARDDPDQLLSCAKHLYKMYVALKDGSESTWGPSKPSILPLVIKTPTCFRAYGEQALTSLLLHFSPVLTHWYSVGPFPYFDDYKPALKIPEVKLDGLTFANGLLLTSETLFEMQQQAYFHAEQTLSAHKKWNCEPLSLAAPYTVPYTGNQPGFLAIHLSGDFRWPHRLHDILNGAIVAITIIQDLEKFPTARIKSSEPSGIPYLAPDSLGIHPPLDPHNSSTIGFGYVQSVRHAECALDIVTPIARDIMEKLPHDRIVLQVGLVPAPGWAYLEAATLAGTVSVPEDEEGEIMETDKMPQAWVRERGRGGTTVLNSWLGQSAKKARAP
ncbi:hypothetical protein P152DRAFT_67348 [Eremomyces bilateralis CBS 781.70]|uniref:Uncharacterized protein n=1 Tax=Eremomyces bilateralis CBS 781.70 TaxID=1392243 RepID=A0A6G1FZI9_9PEZI|nr:uncharacterized protein P152DRAFT_67348 [Eremomyces bilateralis CBS 781.70]KAF1811267.1 hypothetical protein P152DRAFT_67348 [Eremomyces bilateralis CBS 781.70]